eukprot:GILJ01006006.1.p4 GENE.GILJ01006006.1~~GILJ01006006.1.p4  ORF type:complete len:125 (+),score=11.08 GILJ01006006.1:1223-1597(+)
MCLICRTGCHPTATALLFLSSQGTIGPVVEDKLNLVSAPSPSEASAAAADGIDSESYVVCQLEQLRDLQDYLFDLGLVIQKWAGKTAADVSTVSKKCRDFAARVRSSLEEVMRDRESEPLCSCT